MVVAGEGGFSGLGGGLRVYGWRSGGGVVVAARLQEG